MQTSFGLFIGGLILFMIFLFIMWIMENRYRSRDDEMQVVKNGQMIKMKEREIIGKYVERGGELPYRRDDPMRRYEELERR